MTMNATLVLVPGLMCDHTVWADMRTHMGATGLGAVVPDHGRANSLTQMAEQILQRYPGPLNVAGHSMGGRVAMEMWRLAPQRVQRLALLDTGFAACPAGEAGQAEADKRYALLDTAKRDGVQAMARVWVQGMVHPQRLSDAGLLGEIVEMFARRDAGHFEAQIQALLARPDATAQLQSIPGQVWLVCGAQDSWSPPAQHEAMAALLPQSTLEVIEDAGHMAPMERPQAVAQALLRWLQSPAMV
ncbi:MAG: hypothetical protein RIS04_1186 [Pseudomonadota bacterium]